MLIRVDRIIPGDNDRTQFDPQDIAALAGSIEQRGLIEPIVLQSVRGGWYKLIAGERRYRAHLELGWPEIEAIVRDDLDDATVDGMMLDENLHRADLDPLDEAAAYAKRMAKYGWTVKDLAARHRVSETRIRERLALLQLREDIQRLVRSGQMPLKYALAMRGLDNNFQLIALRYFQRTKRHDVGEFRSLCSDLLQKQNQATLWDMDSLMELPDLTPAFVFDPVDWVWGGVAMFV